MLHSVISTQTLLCLGVSRESDPAGTPALALRLIQRARRCILRKGCCVCSLRCLMLGCRCGRGQYDGQTAVAAVEVAEGEVGAGEAAVDVALGSGSCLRLVLGRRKSR